MTDEERDKALRQRESMARFVRGDAQALRFLELFFHLTQVWDDLVDRDREVEPEAVNRAFWAALVELPQNSFYLRHMEDLRPVIRAYAADWLDATALESGTTHDRTVAFTLRDRVGGLISQCAYLTGGFDWMRRIGLEVRAMVHDETLGHYLRGLK